MKKCKVCQANSYSDYCNKHKPRKAIKKTPLRSKPTGKKKARNDTSYKRKGKKAHTQKRKSIAKLKSRLWTIFSKFIRLRDTDERGYGACITSGRVLHYKELQAGHFQSRRFNATFIHEKNVSAQSPHDNLYLSGNQYVFGKKIDEKWGEGTADEMVALSRTDFKFTIEWLEEKTKYYTEEVEKMWKTKLFRL